MSKIRFAIVGLAVLCTAVMIAVPPAQAQTATPTVTPPPAPSCTQRPDAAPCSGAKLRVMWFAKEPANARVFVSTTGCPTAPICGEGVADGQLVSVPPVTLTITDALDFSMSKQSTDPGVNVNGCPSGTDMYRGLDRLRLVYGAATTLVAKMKFPLDQPGSPALTPPITIAASDACGSLINATVNTCYLKASATVSSLKCF